jgi:hypothetical protein
MPGTIKTSNRLIKSTWGVMRLDRELLLLPLISSLIILPIVGLGIAKLVVTSNFSTIDGAAQSSSSANLWYFIPIMFVVTLIGNFFNSALIWGALERFRGNDPTIRSSLARARQRFAPVAVFGTISFAIGTVLQIIESYAPWFVGRLFAWLAGIAWSVANVFSICTIVDSSDGISLFNPTKKSTELIRKTWGTSLVASFSLGIISFLAILPGVGLLATGVINTLVRSNAEGLHPSMFVLPAMPGLILIFAASLITSALTIILKTAVYYYAVTGVAPSGFDHELLRARITHKKAAKIFS